MRGSTRIAFAAGVALAAVVGVLVWRRVQAAPTGEPVTTERAAVRNITQVVTATGKIQPEVEVKITAEVYGEILDLPFREGAAVKKGDLIVRLKPDLYQAQVDQQVAAEDMARGQAIHSQASLAKAASDLREYEDLHRRGLASESDYITYRTNFDTAKADYAAALANVQQADGLLGQARDSLTKTKIYAPMDGTVSLLSSEVGESVVAQSSFTGTEIMRVADLSHMEAQVDVNENDIPNVKLGDRATISIDAYPDRKFAGEVTAIGSSAENTGATSNGTTAQTSGTATDEVTNFLVKIRIADRDVILRPGMSATADIATQTAPNVVAVPIQCVTVRDQGGLNSEQMRQHEDRAAENRSGAAPGADAEREAARRSRELLQHVVFVKVGGKVRMQPIETGIADDAWIEVKRGVRPGDEVVSGSYAAVSRRLKDGMAVRIEAPPKSEGAN